MGRGVKFAQGIHTVSRAVGKQLISLAHAKWFAVQQIKMHGLNSPDHDAARLVRLGFISVALLFHDNNILYYIINEEI